MKLNVQEGINQFPNLQSQLNEYLPLENSYLNNFNKYICQPSETLIDGNSQFWQLSNEEESLSDSSHSDLKKSFKKLIRCSFITWLDKQKEFNDAKIILVNHGLIFLNQKSIRSIDDYSRLTSLHAICARIINYIADEKRVINERCVSKKELMQIQSLSERLKEKLEKKLIHNEDAKQYHLIDLLNETINIKSPNIRNSRKKHEYILRQVMTKELITSAIRIYGIHPLSIDSIIDIALKITGIFFNPMEKKDAEIIAHEILENLKANEKYNDQLVYYALGERQIRLIEAQNRVECFILNKNIHSAG